MDDGFGRVIQERQRGVRVDDAKKDVVVVTDYNALGQVACVSVQDTTTNNTFYSTRCSGSSVKTTMTYDALGRKTGMSDPDMGSGWT